MCLISGYVYINPCHFSWPLVSWWSALNWTLTMQCPTILLYFALSGYGLVTFHHETNRFQTVSDLSFFFGSAYLRILFLCFAPKMIKGWSLITEKKASSSTGSLVADTTPAMQKLKKECTCILISWNPLYEGPLSGNMHWRQNSDPSYERNKPFSQSYEHFP